MKENYKLLKAKIKAAQTEQELQVLDRSVSRIYDAGQISTTQAGRLFTLIMEREVMIENI